MSLLSQTAEMNQRLSKLGEAGLKKFALEDTEAYSVYNFEGQDWKEKQIDVSVDDVILLAC